MKKDAILFIVFLLSLTVAVSSHATVAQISFDEPGISAYTDKGYTDPRTNGDTITNQYTASDGVTWINDPSTGIAVINFVTIGAEFPDPDIPELVDGFPSDGQILWAYENKHWIRLSLPATSLSFDFRRPKQGGSITVDLYNWDGTGALPAPINATPYSFSWEANSTYDNWTFCTINAAPQLFNVVHIAATSKFVIDNMRVTMLDPPAASFSATPTTGCNPQIVTFTDQSAYAESWLWDFGDGETSTDQNPSHTYIAIGAYTVSLTVSNQVDEDTETKTNYIIVGNCALPTAYFSASPVSGGPPPLTVQFSNGSSDGVSWLWDFGDGATSTSRNPSHDYRAPGTYTVSLTVTNPYGEDRETKTDYIFVSPEEVVRQVYYPHVAIVNGWNTEIAVINTSPDTTLTGTLTAYDGAGSVVSTAIPITLAAHGRRQIDVASEFFGAADIGYLILETTSDTVAGYSKFYKNGLYRSAIPASSAINSGDIYVSHIASNNNWWTGLALVNTTDATKELTIDFDNGASKTVTINAGEHTSFTVKSLFEGPSQPDINSAVIKNGSGVIGLELFGNDTQLEGIPLTDETTTTLYYPHVADNATWWTGVVGYNSLSTTSTMTVTPYEADGTALVPQSQDLPGNERIFGQPAGLGLPEGTAWVDMDTAGGGLTGFELFGTRDGAQLGGFFGLGAVRQTGVFAKIEKNGWTGISFVNTEAEAATVTLTAYDNSGAIVAMTTLDLGGYEKVVGQAPNLFTGQDISTATYIGYTSNRDVVGFQLNGSSDETMLDCLPGM